MGNLILLEELLMHNCSLSGPIPIVQGMINLP
uniref:Uncharacterized protein n=1 Tax=Rhizophora mucronata TaxID=61149 RepID=A0A2P2MES9_RHIMU